MKKVIGFGAATAEIIVWPEVVNKHFDGMKIGEEVRANSKVVIIAPSGQAVTESVDASYIGSTTYVGDASTQGSETGKRISALIKEMKEDVLNTTEEKANKMDVAKEIVEQAEKQGIENLMTEKEVKEWYVSYNELANEGGEGYIPHKVSKEEYELAKGLIQ